MLSKFKMKAIITAMIAGTFACSAPAWAQQAAATAASAETAESVPPGYTMPATQVWEMDSEGGEVYRIFVSVPVGGEPPRGGYPVLYVLDGNANFGSFAQARWVQEYLPIGKSIVVGVGYPGDKAWDIRRLNDYTAALKDPPPREARSFTKYKSGARKEFLDFMTGKLRTEIERRYPVNSDRQSLFGHSFGGLFALYAFYERPQAFQSIVAASPSMEWNDQSILGDERVFTEKLLAGKVGKTSRLMVVVGERDADDSPESAQALVERLRGLSGHGVRIRMRSYPDETHVGVPARAANDVLRFAFETR